MIISKFSVTSKTFSPCSKSTQKQCDFMIQGTEECGRNDNWKQNLFLLIPDPLAFKMHQNIE